MIELEATGVLMSRVIAGLVPGGEVTIPGGGERWMREEVRRDEFQLLSGVEPFAARVVRGRRLAPSYPTPLPRFTGARGD